MKRLIVALCAVVSIGVFAGEYEDTLNIVEQWIQKEYPKSQRARKSLEDKLDAICKSKAEETKKIAELKKTFPQAFQKAELPLIILPPLSWRIHSLTLGYDIHESATRTTREVDIFKALAEFDVTRKKSDTKIFGHKINAGIGISHNTAIKLNLNFNPLEWLNSGLSSQTSLSASASYGYDWSKQNSDLWSSNQRNIFSQERQRIIQMVSQQGISKRHLTFTLTVSNNSNEMMICDLSSSYIPVYMGERACNNNAVPYNMPSREIQIGPHLTKDIVFRMELNTTTALELVKFMGENAPTIDLLKGGNLQVVSRQYPRGIVEQTIKRTAATPVELQVPDFSACWNLRKLHTSDSRPVTLREALKAIDKDIHNWSGHKIFEWKDQELVAVSGIPFGAFSPEDEEEEYLVFFQFGNQIVNQVTQKQLDAPLPGRGLTLWVVNLNLEKMEHYSKVTPILQEAIYNKVKQEAELNKPLWQCRLGECYSDGIGVSKNDTEAYKWCRKSAENGNEWGQLVLGAAYFSGEHVPQDFDEAAKWMRKAAEQGNSYGEFFLAFLYASGQGVPKDSNEAAKWIRKSAEQDNAYGQALLGGLYLNGEGVPKNVDEGIKWLRKSVEQDNPLGEYLLGMQYLNGEAVPKSPSEGVALIRRAAEQDYDDAQAMLGALYYTGTGVPKDLQEAVKWLRKAAEQGNALGQYALGVRYMNGEGVPENSEEGAKLIRKAAEQDYDDAQAMLGALYYTGTGVPKDLQEAVKWLRKAAEQGNAEGQNWLALRYLNGEGVPKDPDEAVKWFTKAAEQGNVDAQATLGQLYFNGEIIAKDLSKAEKWVSKAAEQGNADAQVTLGVLYYAGEGVPQALPKAAKLFQQAAEQGNATGQGLLGLRYLNGEGVPKNLQEAEKWLRKAAEQGEPVGQSGLGDYYIMIKDYVEAAKWYRMAAEHGFANAQFSLGICYAQGWGVPQDRTEAIRWIRKAAEQGFEPAQETLRNLGE